MNSMNRYLNCLAACLLALAALSSCNDDNEPTSVVEPEPSGYCLMFYMSGGTAKHDLLLMESARQAAEATGDDVAVTVLMKASGKAEGEAHNGTRRYTAQDGALVQDEAFGTATDFAVTSPASLAEFIRWSAEQYPGRRYLLAFAGQGSTFRPWSDLPDTEESTRAADAPRTRATLYDNDKVMTTAQLGDAIRQSGVALEALIAHSGAQGSIEMLAEWEGTADYLLGSPFDIPDNAYDYASLIGDLRQGCGVEEALKRTARRAISLWQEFHDAGLCGLVVEVTRLHNLTPLWDVLRETLALMHASMADVNITTDPPAVYGDTYGQGYMRALIAKYSGDDDFLQELRPFYTIDLMDYLHAAYTYSGNMRLAPCVNRLDEVLASIIVAHHQTDGGHDFIYNAYTNLFTDDEDRKLYRQCRFEQLTGWTDFYEGLMSFVNALPDKQGPVLTPIAEHITGKWKLVERAYKVYGEWMSEPMRDSYVRTITLREDGKFLNAITDYNLTHLNATDWGDTDDTNYTFHTGYEDGYGEWIKILRLTKNELEITAIEGPSTRGFVRLRLSFRRIDNEPLTLAERMVGRWTLARRYEKADGGWVEVTDGLPAEHWYEYTEAGFFNSCTRRPDGEEQQAADMLWSVHEPTGVVEYYSPDDYRTSKYFRIALEADDTRMVMNHAEGYDPGLDEQVNTEYKDIFIKEQ